MKQWTLEGKTAMFTKHSPKCIPYLASQDISCPQIEGRTLAQQIKDKHDAIKQAIHKIDKEHDPKQTNWIKKKQQKKISKQPTQANQILGGEIEQSGNQALMDPASNMVQTEPSKINTKIQLKQETTCLQILMLP